MCAVANQDVRAANADDDECRGVGGGDGAPNPRKSSLFCRFLQSTFLAPNLAKFKIRDGWRIQDLCREGGQSDDQKYKRDIRYV